MSVRIGIRYLDQKALHKDLTFQYKTKNVMKYKSKSPPKPKEVSCYACITVSGKIYVSLPFAWAYARFDLPERTRSVFNYKAIKTPWSLQQTSELESVVKSLTENKSVALTLRTGAGKTAVALFTACHFKGLTVILVHNDQLADQWAKAISSYTDASCQIVDLKGTPIYKETEFVVCLYTRWAKTPLYVRRNLKLLIIDECDDFCNLSGMKSIIGDETEQGFQPEMVLGCTATFKRPGTGLDVLMNCVLGTEYITRVFDVDFTVNKINTGISGTRVDSKYTQGIEWNTLNKSLLYNPVRIELACQFIALRVEQGRKPMVLCTENKHAKAIYEQLILDSVNADWFYGNRKSYEDSDVLVVGTKKGGRGFDEENACKDWKGKRVDCVIIVGFVNNETNLTQWIGRAFRAKNPIVDHFVDDDKTVEKQWRNMCEVYKWMGANLMQINLGSN